MADVDRPCARSRDHLARARGRRADRNRALDRRYTFSTGRRVENDIQARFTFDQNALITDHVDDFNFRRWASQALGPKGHLLALLPPLRSKARAQALAQLTAFKRGEAASDN